MINMENKLFYKSKEKLVNPLSKFSDKIRSLKYKKVSKVKRTAAY